MDFFFLSEYTVLPILVYWCAEALRGKIAYYKYNTLKSLFNKDLDAEKYREQLVFG